MRLRGGLRSQERRTHLAVADRDQDELIGRQCDATDVSSTLTSVTSTHLILGRRARLSALRLRRSRRHPAGCERIRAARCRRRVLTARRPRARGLRAGRRRGSAVLRPPQADAVPRRSHPRPALVHLRGRRRRGARGRAALADRRPRPARRAHDLRADRRVGGARAAARALRRPARVPRPVAPRPRGLAPVPRRHRRVRRRRAARAGRPRPPAARRQRRDQRPHGGRSPDRAPTT